MNSKFKFFFVFFISMVYNVLYAKSVKKIESDELSPAVAAYKATEAVNKSRIAAESAQNRVDEITRNLENEVKRIREADSISNLIKKRQRSEYLKKKYGNNATNIEYGQIEIGMTKEMCRDALGEPTQINRTRTVNATHEQWVYESKYDYKTMYVYFENGKITAIQD